MPEFDILEFQQIFNEQNFTQESSLTLEAAFESRWIAQVLMALKGADISATINGNSLVLHAIKNQCFIAARVLADAGACIDPEYEAEHANELRLWTAVLRSDLDELRRRIDAGDSVDQAPQGGNAKGWTALWLAVALGREDAARMLIQAGADVNAKCDTIHDSYSVIMWCIYHRMHNLSLFILDHHTPVSDLGALVRLAAASKAPHVLARAARLAHAGGVVLPEFIEAGYYALDNSFLGVVEYVELVTRLLVEIGAAVDGTTATISPLVPSDVIRAIVSEDTPFWLAANNDAAMLVAELAGGLDPNMKTENGMTLLHWACAGDAPECVQLLLDAGADHESTVCLVDIDSDCSEDIESEFGLTPVFYSIHQSSADCLLALRSAGACVTKSINRDEPLHLAVAKNALDCLTVLLFSYKALDWSFLEQFYDLPSSLTQLLPVFNDTGAISDLVEVLVASSSLHQLQHLCPGFDDSLRQHLERATQAAEKECFDARREREFISAYKTLAYLKSIKSN